MPHHLVMGCLESHGSGGGGRDGDSQSVGDCSVDIRDLVKYHGSALAVDHCSFTVRKGEFFSILGPSGSGKTTTLRLLAGLERPDRGEILIEGRPMHGVPPHRRPVNLVFQNYALFPHLTAFANIAFGLEMRRVPKADIMSQVHAALDMMKLRDKQDRLPSQLSGGEQQRVALARALINRPAVVLLDEPLGALDQQLRLDMQIELKSIQAQVGLTFIYVTHHQEEALTMSDRVAVMNGGRVLQVGSPQAIYEFPGSLFTANFIGLSNHLTGRVTAANGSRCTLRAPGLSEISIARSGDIKDDHPVTLVLRPERLSLSLEQSCKEFDNSVRARVEKAIYNGSEMHYWVRLSDQVQWKVRVPNAGVDQKRFLPGEAVFVQWQAKEGMLLTE